MPGVFLNEDDYNFDIALRRFKKQVEKAGILSEMKKRQHFEKPSVMRKCIPSFLAGLLPQTSGAFPCLSRLSFRQPGRTIS